MDSTESLVAPSFIPCVEKVLPFELVLEAAKVAIQHNPANEAKPQSLTQAAEVPSPEYLALMTSRYWGASGVNLSVQFLDTSDQSLIQRILSHMNAWGERCNVKFSWTQGQGKVRIARNPRDGYWSYLGTDVLQIPAGQATMNLANFSMNTPESEYARVVRHETGHTLGFVHEHLRRAIVARLDAQKTIAYFMQTQGWSAQVTTQQVLTPIEEAQLTGNTPEETSIMCYQLPAQITTDGRPIMGGSDITVNDFALAMQLYPKQQAPTPTPTPTPPATQWKIVITGTGPKPTIVQE